jgi:hypothetical protein
MIGGVPGAVVGGIVGAFQDATAGADKYKRSLQELAQAADSAATPLEDLLTKAASAQRIGQSSYYDKNHVSGFGDFVGDSFTHISDLFSGNMRGQKDATSIARTDNQISALSGNLAAIGGLTGMPVHAGTAADAAAVGVPEGYVANLQQLGRVAAYVQPSLARLGMTWSDLMNPTGTGDSVTWAERFLKQVRALDSEAGRLHGLSTSLSDIDGNLLSTAKSASQFSTALGALIDPELNLISEGDRWQQGLNDLKGNLSSSTKSLFGHSDAVIQNRTAMVGMVQQIEKTLTAEAAAGASSQKIARDLGTYRQALLHSAVAAGMSRKQVEEFLRLAGLTPKLVKTTFQAAGLDWILKNIPRLHHAYDSLPQSVKSRIDLRGTPEAKAKLRELIRSLPKDQKKIVMDLKSASAKTGITNVNKLLDQLDAKAKKEKKAKVDTSQATSAIRTLQQLWANWTPPTKTVHVQTVGKPGGGANENGGLYVGGYRAFADGGYGAGGRYYSRTPQIVAGGANVLWGEKATGWEAYISGKPSQRARNLAVWAEAGRRLGVGSDPRARLQAHIAAGYNPHGVGPGGGVSRTVVIRQELPSQLTLSIDGKSFNAHVDGRALRVATKAAEQAINANSIFWNEQG